MVSEQQRVEARERLAQLSTAEALELASIEAQRIQRTIGTTAAPTVETGRFLTSLVQQNTQGDDLARQQVRELKNQVRLLGEAVGGINRAAGVLESAPEVYVAGRN